MTQPAPPIRVFLADDHAVVRGGLCALLESQADMVVVGQCAAATDLVERARAGAWNVLVLDLALEGSDDANLIAAIRARHPRGRILVYSAHPEGPLALAALRAGADGYVCKQRSLDELLVAIRTVHIDGSYVTGAIASLLLRASSPAQAPTLTDRELAVLVRLARGERPSDIASALDVKPSTVSTHLRAIKNKLGVDSIAELVRHALRTGLIG